MVVEGGLILNLFFMEEILEPVEDVPTDPACPVDPQEALKCDSCE